MEEESLNAKKQTPLEVAEVFWFSLIWKIRLCGLAGKG
jgi:hypothetical protein